MSLPQFWRCFRKTIDLRKRARSDAMEDMAVSVGAMFSKDGGKLFTKLLTELRKIDAGAEGNSPSDTPGQA